jgi:hypothetical protein
MPFSPKIGENSDISIEPLAFVGLAPSQGCKMVYFQTKMTNLGEFIRVWEWKWWVYHTYGHMEYTYHGH